VDRSGFRSADIAEVKQRFDLRTRTRKSRNAADALKLGVRVGADSILPISKEQKLPQEKAADKWWRVRPE
jgi:hypothetical protein